jgi:hypothetical protein
MVTAECAQKSFASQESSGRAASHCRSERLRLADELPFEKPFTMPAKSEEKRPGG